MPCHPYRRLHVNPALRDAVSLDGRPGWLLAVLSGLHHSKFSALIHAISVPDRPRNVERLHRIANTVGFPSTAIFIGGSPAEDTFHIIPSPPVEAR